MALALRAARLGLGTTAPNPSVGAVIADEATGTVISTGTTAPGGRPHAEPVAIAQAGAAVQGKTLYVTLEPCSHVGRTRPCVEAILKAGLSRVVIAQEDPDPRVSGRGVRMLRDAGVVVERGLLRDQAHWLTRGHIVRVTERRPFIQLKLALSADGAVPHAVDGRPLFVTGTISRAHGHMLRARSDAILVGAGTLRDDNPDLTCRLPGLGDRSPVRVVLAGKSLPDPQCQLAQSAEKVPVWIMATAECIASDPACAEALTKLGCRLIVIGGVGGKPWLPSLCEALVAEGITRLLVEGGPKIWHAFAEAGLVDEVVVFHAGQAEQRANRAAESADPIDSTSAEPQLDLSALLPGLELQVWERRQTGSDEMIKLRLSTLPEQP